MADNGRTGGWIKRLFGGGGSGTANPAIVKDFAWLDKVEAGFANKVATYILTGSPATVVASLQAQSAQITKAFRDHMRTSPPRHLAEQTSDPRTDNIIFGAADLHRAARYVTALDLTEHAVSQYYNIGSDSIPKPVKTLFQQVGIHRRFSKEQQNRLSMNDLVDLIGLLGGRPADLVDHVMTNRWTPLANLFGDRDTVEGFALGLDPSEVITGITRLAAAQQAEAIKALTWRKIATAPAYLDYLLESLGSGSAKVRDEARAALVSHDPQTVTGSIIPLASSGKVAVRTAAIQTLGEIGTDTAMDALRERRDVEKAQSVQMLLDQILGSSGQSEAAQIDGGYQAVDGSTVTVPPRIALSDASGKPFGKDDLAALHEVDARLEEKDREYVARIKAQGHKIRESRKVTYGQDVFAVFTGEKSAGNPRGQQASDSKLVQVNLTYIPPAYHNWIAQALNRLPTAKALEISLASLYDLSGIFGEWNPTPMSEWIGDALRAGKVDLRDVLEAAGKRSLILRSRDYREQPKTVEAAEFTRRWIEMSTEGGRWTPDRMAESFGPEPCWPAIAAHLDVVAAALPPGNLTAQANEGAIAMLELLPALPAHLVNPLLFVAIGDGRGARERARALLTTVDGLDDAIAATLSDKRQAIRANAASFLAQRGAKSALPELVKRLKTEKSETARAAMISAVADLGGDTSPYLSQKALLAEAEKLVAKLPAKKIEWLSLDQAPAVRWANGKAVEPAVIDAWVRLAVKLKDPADGAMFDLYLAQLDKDDAEKLAGWLLSSWIGYDTLRPPMSEMIAKVTPTAEQYKANYSHYKNTPLDEIVAMLVRYQMQGYPNSGSDAKGLLSMTHRAPPALMARSVGGYLKDHGKRVAQAKAMVDVLAGAGTPEAIQLLVATSTRFKQRTVREHAENSVIKLAEERGWTADELADRSIPSGGLEEGGAMELEVGEELKTYVVRLAPDMSVRIVNPAGKEVKSLPAGKDAATKEAKSLLASLKKTVKTVTAQQQMRLYEAMMEGRVWRREDWQSDLNAHPIMSRLTERVVWRALDADGKPYATFRPTPEGDLFDASGDDADISAAAGVDIAHAATLGKDAREAWQAHMKDFEVAPLFPQLTRPVLELTEKQRNETELTDREGWLMEALKLRSATTKLGYDRGPVEDGAGFSEYRKTFRSSGIVATLHFTGSYVPEDNIPVAITRMTFNKGRREIKLGDVPPLLLSECWNDMHDIAKSGAFDPEWAKKGLY